VTATVPFAETSTDGVNACWSPIGIVVGVWLTLIGADQVSPPSSDCYNAIASA
jgi:hypothetical protein